MYALEQLQQKNLTELKEIGWQLNLVPDGDRRLRRNWIKVLTGAEFPPPEVPEVLPHTETIQALGAIENSLDADHIQEPIEIQTQEPIENFLDADQIQEPIEIQVQEQIENPPGADRTQEPIENPPGADRTQEPIEFSDLDEALAEIARLRAENQELMQQVRSHKQTIYEAKDITPVQKCSFIRVLKLARAACLDLSKSVTGGWTLSLGPLQRTFKTLYQIWRLLVVGEWNLSDLFHPPEKTPIPSPDAFSHNAIGDWLSALGSVGLPEPLEAAQSRRTSSQFVAIPFCDDGLIDSYALGFAESRGRSPPGG